ncbi:MAG: response regulator [Rhodospirillales bacterium]|jgi:two-component system, chemotaxis family, chemotaxis protein CheY|nr:response regulator [Rhodospirillales bacterium]
MNKSIDFSETHVLVIDDEEFMRKMICRLLGMIGVTKISVATDGSDGLSKLMDDPPDLIVLDIMMEPMNGLKFLKSVRIGLSGAARDLPVIVLTGSNEQAVFGTAMALDCNAFVRKAESSDAIRDRMARVLTEPLEIDKTAVYHAVKIPDITINAPPADPPQEDTPPSAEAYQVSIEDVPTGALVARNVTTVDGSMLLAAGSVLSGANLNRLKDLSEIVELSSIWVET